MPSCRPAARAKGHCALSILKWRSTPGAERALGGKLQSLGGAREFASSVVLEPEVGWLGEVGQGDAVVMGRPVAAGRPIVCASAS